MANIVTTPYFYQKPIFYQKTATLYDTRNTRLLSGLINKAKTLGVKQ